MNFQTIILKLQKFWADQNCIMGQPYDVEKGAGTMNPSTFLRVLGPEPWRVAYVEPSRRPADGRYGDNPNRLFQHHQYQVIINRLRIIFRSFISRAWPNWVSVRKNMISVLLRITGNHRLRCLGTWLGGLAGWYGNYPVHLFSAGRQYRRETCYC